MIQAGKAVIDCQVSDTLRQAIAVDAMGAEESAAGWVPFYAAVFGRGGSIATRLTPLQRLAYRQLPEFYDLHERVADMRARDTSKSTAFEPVQMITTRVPRSLHEVLIDEAAECRVSMQSLCITKLLLPADDRFVPVSDRKPRGRRPGCQGSGSQQPSPQ